MTGQTLHGFVELTNEAYHAGPGISKSHTDSAAKSAQHYWKDFIDPSREPKEPTDEMRQGTLIHTAVLEPDSASSRYIMLPEDAPKRPTSAQLNAKKPSPETVEAIKWWDDFSQKAEGKEVITKEWWDMAWACRKAIFEEPSAAKILAQGQPEQAIFATDPETGLLLKCKPDWLRPGMMVDIKSTVDASPSEFFRTMGKRRYHIQHPFYTDVHKHAFGEKIDHFFYVAVEKTWPYNVGVYYLLPEQILQAREQYKKDLRTIQEVRSGNGQYIGGYTAKSGPIAADIPPYFFK